MTKVSEGRIVGKERLIFENNASLRAHYEQVWANGGYSNGYVLNGVLISQLYHEGRRASALSLLKPSRREKILDAGCGDGVLSLRIAETGAETYGVDISGSALLHLDSQNYRNPSFCQMNLEQLGFRDETFDKIVCVETLEHLLDPEAAINEFGRVLKTNGRVILTYPFLNTRPGQRERIAKDPRRYISISEHLTEWDYDTLVDKFKSRGLYLDKSRGIVVDLGWFNNLQKFSKAATKAMVKTRLAIKMFPRRSLFASFRFKKRE